ncbi:MAG: VOC family protein [bacterium]
MNSESDGLIDCRPILAVNSVAKSIRYYHDVLGFSVGWAWSDETNAFLNDGDEFAPSFALVVRGKIQLMLAETGQGTRGTWLHLDVRTADHLDDLFQEWSKTSANIVEKPSLRPWGMYEMRIQDLDQHVFRVSSPPRETA